MSIILFTITAVSVEFKRSSYSVDEASTAMLMLMLSNESSTDISFTVSSNDITATGMCTVLLSL